MTSNYSVSGDLNSETHRSHPGAVLSGMRKFFVILAGLGLILFAVLALRDYQSQKGISPINNYATSNDFQPKPERLMIKSLNIDAAMEDLDLNRDNTLEVPKKGENVGWYVRSPVPGAVGPAVLVGHLDSTDGKAVFYDLKKIKQGDEFEVKREDGSIAVFRVDRVENFSQDKFPTLEVYGPLNYAGIRLITCSGSFSPLKGRYSDNLVVFGSLVKINS